MEMKRSVKNSVNILGVMVDDLSKDDVIDAILSNVNLRKKSVFAYVNVHTINLAWKNHWFRDFLNNSEIVFCDGFGVKFAAKFLYRREIRRFTPPDWLPFLISRAIMENRKFFFLGGKPGIAEKAAGNLEKKIPGFTVQGTHHGYADKNHESVENQSLIKEINQAGADILLVGFGMPTQEKWIKENLPDLNVSAVLPVGAAFDYLAGETQRAPTWMTDHGFEWLGRLLIEPGRLWKRYLMGNPMFLYRVLLTKIGWLKIREIE